MTDTKSEIADEEMDDETLKDWREKMNEPIGFRKLTEEEVEKLHEQGRI